MVWVVLRKLARVGLKVYQGGAGEVDQGGAGGVDQGGGWRPHGFGDDACSDVCHGGIEVVAVLSCGIVA